MITNGHVLNHCSCLAYIYSQTESDTMSTWERVPLPVRSATEPSQQYAENSFTNAHTCDRIRWCLRVITEVPQLFLLLGNATLTSSKFEKCESPHATRVHSGKLPGDPVDDMSQFDSVLLTTAEDTVHRAVALSHAWSMRIPIQPTKGNRH